MNNLVPADWSIKSISDIAKVGSSKRILQSEYVKRGVPFFRSKEAILRSKKLPISSPLYISRERFNEIKTRFGAPVKDEILVTAVGTIGVIYLIEDIEFYFKDGNLLWIRHIDRNVSSSYLAKYLASDVFQESITRITSGSSQAALTIEKLSELTFNLPPLPEQQKIAAILTSIDEVIEKTQAQIDKLKDLKSGMMQELLTKGVGIKQGDKYEPYTEFKDSPVGRIPKNWDCSLLDKVAKRGSGHTPDKQKPEYWNGGIKWISLSDSSKLDNLHIHDSSKKISQLGIDNSSAALHPKGSVIMARDAGIGKSAIITSAMAVSQHFMAWVCGEKLNNYFLYYLLQLWKPTFENIAMGSTIKTIGLPYFKKLQIPVPPIEEQKLIADSLISVENKIFALQQKHTTLSNTKKALMQDLLTGKVRVKVAEQV